MYGIASLIYFLNAHNPSFSTSRLAMKYMQLLFLYRLSEPEKNSDSERPIEDYSMKKLRSFDLSIF